MIFGSVGEIYEYALQPEHRTSVNPHVYETCITDTGALAVSSGLKTGRTPKEKRVVLDETTKDVSANPISFHGKLIHYRLSGGAVLTSLSNPRAMPETEEGPSTSSTSDQE